MKTSYLKKLGSLLIAVLLVGGAVFMVPATAQAQRRVVIVRPIRPFGFRPWGWGYPYGPYGPYGTYYSQYVFDSSDSALNQGYHDGVKTGQSDGRKDKSYNPQRSHYYHDAGFGNYAEVYRSGFSRGYRDGYSEGGGRRG